MTIIENANELNVQSSLKYIICACIAGAAAKMYDDIEDNFRLAHFKTAHNMELLKGIHFITFTVVGIAYPLCFIIMYIIVFTNKITTPSAYVLPYENSLLYSFAFLFLFLDYSKLHTFLNVDYYYIAIAFIAFGVGELFFNSLVIFIDKFYKFKYCDLLTEHEVSHFKLISRFVSTLLMLLFCFYSTSSNIKYIVLYIIGYVLISCCTQFYSLYIYKAPQPNEVPPIIEEKKEETPEQPVIKEDPALSASTSEPTV